MRFYGGTVESLHDAGYSVFVLAACAAYLPSGSATGIATGGESALWGLDSHLLAAVFDRLGAIEFALAGANWQRGGGKGKKPTPPKPLPRPGEHEASEARLEDARARARAWKAAHIPQDGAVIEQTS